MSLSGTSGTEMHRFISDLYPICRSITGDGVRRTLQLINRHVPLSLREVPTGTAVYDWIIPKEWNIRDAYIRNSHGDKIVDFKQCNLSVVSYSVPVHKTVKLAELKEHVYSIPDRPEWIPYRTSYYRDNWGFCLSHQMLAQLTEESYEVCIDSTLRDGSLSIGECSLEGETQEEVLISCHVCHPSLCNDNLSGIAVATFLAKHILRKQRRRLSYRFIFVPATIGAITWLALNEQNAANIKHGLVLTCVGDAGKTTYKKTRRGHADIDRAAMHVLRHSGTEFGILDFSPYGYDERQFCSPGFDLPVGCLMRTPNGCFPEYHTSADNLEFVKADSLEDSLSKAISILNLLEQNRLLTNCLPKCEPQLGKRGLYKQPGTPEHLAQLWVLNLCDGRHTLLDIAERAAMSFPLILESALELESAGLLVERSPHPSHVPDLANR